MLNVSVKTIAGIILCLAASNIGFAFSDSLKNKNNKTAPLNSNVTIIRQANMLYPEMLEGQEAFFSAYVQKFAVNRRAYLQRTYLRSKKFFPKATAILKKYKVPQEFAVLLALESAFNANAISSAGAVGYWQIMDDVAKEYGLKIIENQKKNVAKLPKTTASAAAKTGTKKAPAAGDDRKNFNKSTHTAARYLKDRMRNLNNDWLLVAASYNWGVGNVWRTMQATGKANPDFWDIKDRLPAETRTYVMNFIALNVIFKNYQNFLSNKMYFKDVLQQNKVEKDLASGTVCEIQ